MWRLTSTTGRGFAAALAMSALVGCGGGTNDSAPTPLPARPAAQPTPANTAAAAPDNTVQAMVAEIERSAFTVEARDPFMPPRPNIRTNTETGDGRLVVRPCDTEEHPLGQTSLDRLTLLGLVTGTPLPRAMFRAGDRDQGIIVTEGTFAGPDCEQELVQIRDNEVVFEQRTTGDTARATTVITLNEERVAAEILGYR